MNATGIELCSFLGEILDEGRVHANANLGIFALQDRPEYAEAMAASQDQADRWLAEATCTSQVRLFAGCLEPTVQAMRNVALAQGDLKLVRLVNNPYVHGVFPSNPAVPISGRRCAVLLPNDSTADNVPHADLFADSGRYKLQAVILEDAVRGDTREHTTKLHLLLGQPRSVLAVRYTYLTIEASGIATWTPFEAKLKPDAILQQAALVHKSPQRITEHSVGFPYSNVTPFRVATVGQYVHLDIGSNISKLPTYIEGVAQTLERQLHL